MEHPGRTTALAALLFLLLAPSAVRLPTDNAPEAYFPTDHEALAWLDVSRERFDAARWVRVVATGQALWTREGLAAVGELERAATRVPGVAESLGPASRYGEEDWPPPDPEAFRNRIRASPLARDLGWVSPDGSALSLVLRLASEADVDTTVPRLEALLAGSEGPRRSFRLLGLPVLEHALDRSSREITTRFFPLLGAVVLGLLALALRSPADVAAALLYVLFCLGTLLGAFALAGGSLNLVLAVLPPILFVVTLATAVHLVLRVRDLPPREDDRAEAVATALAQKGRAIVWTGVTTAVGFGSLATAPVGPVRSLGIVAALGLVWATLAAFSLLPALLVLLGGRGRSGRHRPSFFETAARRLAAAAAKGSVRHARLALAAAGAAAVAALIVLPRLEVASNALEYLPTDAPLRRAVAEADALGLPTATVDLVVERSADAPSLESVAGLGRLLELGRALAAEEGVLAVLGPGTLLEEARQVAPGLPGDAGDALRVAALTADPRSRELLRRFVTVDGERARLVVGVRLAGFRELDRLLAELRERARTTAPDLAVHATGEYPLLLATQRSLLATLGTSFLVSLAAILAIFLLVLRSVPWAVVALVPNVLPILLAFGALAAAGLPLDIATAMVAAVILGLAVDDAIHTLLSTRDGPGGRTASVVAAVGANGPAYTLTALLLAAGFGVCGFSDFAPTARFGGLASVAMVLVWAGALWLLPALVALLDRERS